MLYNPRTVNIIKLYRIVQEQGGNEDQSGRDSFQDQWKIIGWQCDKEQNQYPGHPWKNNLADDKKQPEFRL